MRILLTMLLLLTAGCQSYRIPTDDGLLVYWIGCCRTQECADEFERQRAVNKALKE